MIKESIWRFRNTYSANTGAPKYIKQMLTDIKGIKGETDSEALYSQQKQDWELTVAQTMSFLFQNSDLNWRKEEKPWGHSGTT